MDRVHVVCLGWNEKVAEEIRVLDERTQSWRKLPSIENLPQGKIEIFGRSGRVYVWPLWSTSVFKFELGRGSSDWEQIPVLSYRKKLRLFGMKNIDEIWSLSNDGSVLSPAADQENLCGFQCNNEEPKLLRYDDAEDRWESTEEELPRQPCCWKSFRTDVVNADCVIQPETRASVGMNVIIHRNNNDPMFWYNSELQKNWMPIDQDGPEVAGYALFVVQGAIYATLKPANSGYVQVENNIWRGRIDLSKERMVWERVATFPIPIISFTTITC